MNDLIAVLLDIVSTWQWGLFTTVVMLGSIWSTLACLRTYAQLESNYESLCADYMSARNELARVKNAFPVVSELATPKQLPQLPGQNSNL